jgi:hypothetical protein
MNFLINMAFTMACPNFKKVLKMAFGPLGVKLYYWGLGVFTNAYDLQSSYDCAFYCVEV